MSERSPQLNPEQLLAAPEKLPALPTEATAEALRPGEAAARHYDLETAKQQVESAVEAAKEQNPFEQLEHASSSASETLPPPNQELRTAALNHSLQRLQRRLPVPERLLSKTIHQPVIRAVSEGVGTTLSRPSGLLGGGLCAFLGTAAYVYFTHHIGLTYNYFLFTVFFVGGFVLGLVIELLVWLLGSSKTRSY